MHTRPKRLSIIVPAYNEERTIKKVMKKIKELDLRKYNLEKEIIIINDGSVDNTEKTLSNIGGIKLISHNKNMGKGAAIKTGIRNSNGEILMIQDSDLEYDPRQIPRLIKPILEGENVVYGSRFMGKIIGPQIILHTIGNKLLSFFTRVLYNTKITDMETGYKVFRKEVIKDIKIRSNRFDFEPEITAKILKKGYRIKEIPIEFRPRTFSEGKKITWIDGIKALFSLVRYRFFD